MYSFRNDYSEGAHPKVLQRLIDTNLEQTCGYALDPLSDAARETVRRVCAAPEADVHFISGGTQTNLLTIAAFLRPYEAVIAPYTAHISLHEAGAIEATGHKVLTLPEHDGKLRAADVAAYLDTFYADASFDHMVFPGMVFIAHPSELGTLYSLAELEELSALCRRAGIPLSLDGPRLAYGLAAPDTDVTLADIARLCDAFYIGGTKVGALCGEALVYTKKNMPKHFLSIVKQHGALLAKGRLLGIQFDTLFTDRLYFEISRHAIEMAELLKEGLEKKKYPLYLQSPTNQQFVLLENETYQALQKEAAMGFWEKPDPEHTVVRLATSWATRREDVEAFLALL